MTAKRFLAVASFVLVMTAPARAQQSQLREVSYTLPGIWNSCAGWTAGGPVLVGYVPDILPVGVKLRAVTVKWLLGNDHQFAFEGIPTAAVALSGTQIGSPQTVYNFDACQPVAAGQLYTFDSSDYQNGFPGWRSHADNPFTVTVLTSGGLFPTAFPTVTLKYEAPDPIQFSVTANDPPEDRRILLSNLEPGYPYPRFQATTGVDRAVSLFLTAYEPGGALARTATVYLRIVDPADPALYMNQQGNVLAHVGDNAGPPAALEGPNVSAVPNRPGVYEGTTNDFGNLPFTLRLANGTASGDDFQIEGSLDPTFPSGLSWKSGILTAWKRVFVEKHNMLRNGIPMSGEATAGTSVIEVADNRYGGNQGHHHLSRGDRIILVHAPAADRQNALAGWYSEEHTVADVARGPSSYLVTLGTRVGNTTTPELLLHDFGRDPSDLTRPEWADSIARLGSASLAAVDYFDSPDDLVTGGGAPFRDAMAEYFVLPAGPFGFVPMPHFGSSNEDILQSVADKWCISGAGTNAAPNHQILIVGDTDMSQSPDAGVTTSQVLSEVSSWVWRGTIDANVGRQGSNPGANPDTWAAKTEAHELAHQWRPNRAFAGDDHCPPDTVTYDDPTLYCLLAAPDLAVQSQRANGIAKFHLLQLPGGSWHSEYLEIRKADDPHYPPFP